MLPNPNYYFDKKGNQYDKRRKLIPETGIVTAEVQIAAVAGMRIGVFATRVMADADTKVTFGAYNSPGNQTAVEMTYPIGTNGGVAFGNQDAQVPLFVTEQGKGLSMTTTAGNVYGHLIYAVFP